MITNTPETGESKSNPLNYTIQRLTDGTARLLVERKPAPGSPKRPVVVRYVIDEHGEPTILAGALLGFDRINPSLLFIIIRSGDLISIGERTIGKASAVFTHYRVDRGFRLMEIAIKGRCLTYAEIRSLVGPYKLLEQPSGCDDALREFLSDSSHPKWMLPILMRQKMKWRTNCPSKFYHLVPSKIKESEIRRVMKIAPGAALRFFFEHLTIGQVKRCIRRDLKTAIVHSYAHMSLAHLQLAYREYPELLLKHQGDLLPDHLLRACVRFEPFEAFRIRKRFSPYTHAKILSCTCELPFHIFRSGNLSQLPAEIERSFRKFPSIWLDSYGNDFSALFRVLMYKGRMTVDHKLIGFLVNRLPPPYLPYLYAYISKNI